MFKDKAKLNFIAGRGGDGKIGFFKGRKPSGGNGGRGGNIYIEGANNLYDLSHITQNGTYKAEDAAQGGVDNEQGKNGKDLIFKVPLVTKIYDNIGNLILTIDKPNEPQLLLKGGRGGIGNYYFRTQGVEALHKTTPGADGQTLEAAFELELFSDVLLIGFPNAGKSSFLNSVTNAESKVDSYEFTTLNPKLGRMDGITIMDLPGLIEGTSEGKGLGTSFVKHTRSAKLVAHLITLESEKIADEYKKMRFELIKIDKDLFDKEEIVILTKSDLVSPEEINKKVKIMQDYVEKVYVCSVYDFDSLENIKTDLKKMIAE